MPFPSGLEVSLPFVSALYALYIQLFQVRGGISQMAFLHGKVEKGLDEFKREFSRSLVAKGEPNEGRNEASEIEGNFNVLL